MGMIVGSVLDLGRIAVQRVRCKFYGHNWYASPGWIDGYRYLFCFHCHAMERSGE